MCGISESWLSENINDRLITIPNYHCVRLDRSWSDNDHNIKKGGGICCYLKSDVIFSDCELSHKNVSSKNIEMLWISLNKENMKKIIICNLYRPPQGNIATFCEILTNTVNSLSDEMTCDFDLIVMGDFNVNYRYPDKNGYNDIKWFEQRTGLRQLIKEMTRFSQLNSSIDLIFSNCNHISNVGTLDLNISDHQAIFITKKIKLNLRKNWNLLAGLIWVSMKNCFVECYWNLIGINFMILMILTLPGNFLYML